MNKVFHGRFDGNASVQINENCTECPAENERASYE